MGSLKLCTQLTQHKMENRMKNMTNEKQIKQEKVKVNVC